MEDEKHVIEREIQITFKPKEDFVKKETYIGYRFANEKSWYWRDRRDNFFVKLFRLRPFGGERLELIARRLLDDGWKCIELTGDKGSVGEFKRRVGQKRFNFEEMEENRKLQKEFQEGSAERKRVKEEKEKRLKEEKRGKEEEEKRIKEEAADADFIRKLRSCGLTTDEIHHLGNKYNYRFPFWDTSVEELMQCPGIGKKKANSLKRVGF